VPAISDAVNPAAALDYVIQQPLFGDLTFRQRLKDSGVELTAHYISETMTNTAGFHGTGTDYAQQVDFGVGFDLARLGVWSDSIAQFAVSDRAGRSTAGDFTGSYFAYQEIFGQGQNLRIDEISIEKTLPAQAVALKVGFYPMGNDFATLPYVCNFINVAFCGHPQSLPNDSGWSDGPAGRWGGRIKWLITDHVTVQAGAFDSNPTITQRQNGFKLGLSGSTGVIAPIELGYHIGKEPSDYGGTYKVGGYYDSSSAADLGSPQRTDAGVSSRPSGHRPRRARGPMQDLAALEPQAHDAVVLNENLLYARREAQPPAEPLEVLGDETDHSLRASEWIAGLTGAHPFEGEDQSDRGHLGGLTRIEEGADQRVTEPGSILGSTDVGEASQSRGFGQQAQVPEPGRGAVLARIGQRQVCEFAHGLGKVMNRLGVRRGAPQQRLLHMFDVRIDALKASPSEASMRTNSSR